MNRRVTARPSPQSPQSGRARRARPVGCRGGGTIACSVRLRSAPRGPVIAERIDAIAIRGRCGSNLHDPPTLRLRANDLADAGDAFIVVQMWVVDDLKNLPCPMWIDSSLVPSCHWTRPLERPPSPRRRAAPAFTDSIHSARAACASRSGSGSASTALGDTVNTTGAVPSMPTFERCVAVGAMNT